MSRLRLPLALVVFAAAAFFSASGRWPWHRLSHAAPAPLAVVAPALAAPATENLDTLHRGETVSALFARHGVDGIDLPTLSRKLSLDPRRLRAGLVFSFRHAAADSAPDAITVRTSPEQRVLFTRVANEWDAQAEAIEWRPEVVRVEGKIDNSLYEALDGQIPDSVLAGTERTGLAWALADVYDWQVDFTRDIQPGDHFQVVLERLVSAEGDVRFGRILASDLSVGGRQLTAFHFGSGSSFYDLKGNSLKLAFLRAPLEFRRISSVFTRARFHPVLGITRKHEGTDYAAAPGTPVRAAGEGVVIRAGRAGGYGNLIELRHRNGITTRYGHLRAFARGLHAGMRVSQGQQIGYVGSTGLATGPHLHYEFRVNGVAQDSRRVSLGNGPPLTGAELKRFQGERDRLAALLYPAAPAAPVLVAQRTS
jgi:murein DD-endopeptidase MepM/ murein hydrolase activator NlpD